MSHDVRAVANLALDRADELELALTNMAINKILYFAHGHFLAHFGRSLIAEEVEAWDHGPVYREVYRQFQFWGSDPIKDRAKCIEYKTGDLVPYVYEFKEYELGFILPILEFYIRIPAWRLREESHAEGGPWDKVWNHLSPSNPGMIIPDSLIAAYFRQLSARDGGALGELPRSQSAAFRDVFRRYT